MFQVKRAGKITLLGLGLACLIATAIAAVPGLFSSVDSTAGYTVAGAAGASGYALCSDGSHYDLACPIVAPPSNACTSYASTSTAGCTLMADGKYYEWVSGASTSFSGCGGASGGWDAAPSPYSGTCVTPYITLTWPVTFPTGCLAAGVSDNNATIDIPDNPNGTTHASGSWQVIGSPTTTQIEVQRNFWWGDSGQFSTVTGYTGFPRAFCIGN